MYPKVPPSKAKQKEQSRNILKQKQRDELKSVMA